MPTETREKSEALRADFDGAILPHLDGVFRLTMWLVRDRAEAEDVVQETFSQAWQSFHRFQPGTNARAWLLTIMRHVRANRNRARRRMPLDLDTDDQLEHVHAVEQTPQHVTADEVLAALAELPLGYQEVVLLCDVEDLSYREISNVMQIPIGTVMSRLHRARRLLRVALAPYAAAQGIGRGRAGDAVDRPNSHRGTMDDMR
ncbi:MAG TPA: sigma-70 family RNA polymerase sigma factor [Vicinamibacterales bacterium]|nr:sigma-70 family RNA polymerase sigma factor [Vicinamibacterales bacterium]